MNPKTTELQRSQPDRTGARSNWVALAKDAEHNPLLIVPEGEARRAVTRLWMCNAHLIPSALSLCARIRVYLDERTLSPEDVARIADRLVQPELAQRHRFAGDLLADLARLAAEQAAWNEARAANDAMRREAEEARVLRAGNLFKLPGKS